jgi:hypothetical protein
MAVGIRLSSIPLPGLAAVLFTLLASMPVAAQESGARPTPPPRPPSVRQEDCTRIPGGNAPIGRLARLEGGISVRNLDLTYLGKPLFQLTDADFVFLEALWPVCRTFDAETAPTVARRLKALIDDARAVRRASLEWIKESEREAKTLKPDQNGIQKIHDLWQDMLNREFEMTRSDLSYISGVLAARRDELYAAPQARQRTLVSPFDPGPPDVRGIDDRGG